MTPTCSSWTAMDSVHWRGNALSWASTINNALAYIILVLTLSVFGCLYFMFSKHFLWSCFKWNNFSVNVFVLFFLPPELLILSVSIAIGRNSSRQENNSGVSGSLVMSQRDDFYKTHKNAARANEAKHDFTAELCTLCPKIHDSSCISITVLRKIKAIFQKCRQSTIAISSRNWMFIRRDQVCHNQWSVNPEKNVSMTLLRCTVSPIAIRVGKKTLLQA